MADATVTSRREDRAVGRVSTSRALLVGARDARRHGWLFLLPALATYGLFVLWPLVNSFRYSLYNWDGVRPAKWVGIANYKTVFSDPDAPQRPGARLRADDLLLRDPGRPRPDRRLGDETHGSRADRLVRADGALPSPGRAARRGRDRLELGALDAGRREPGSLGGRARKRHACLARRFQLRAPGGRRDRDLGAARVLHGVCCSSA